MAEEKKDAKQKEKRPTAKKRDLQSKKRQAANKSFKSKVNTAIRVFHTSLSSGEKGKAQDSLKAVFSLVDKGVKTHIFKQNKADRIKSRLQQKALA